MGRHLDIVHDEGHPAAKDKHPGSDHGSRMEGSGKWRNATKLRFGPGHCVDVKDPQVSQSAARHTTIYNQPEKKSIKVSRREMNKVCQPWVGAVPICAGCSTVALPGRGSLSIARRNVPLHCVRVGADLQRVEVVQVSWDVVLGILAVICQAAKEKHLEIKMYTRFLNNEQDTQCHSLIRADNAPYFQ